MGEQLMEQFVPDCFIFREGTRIAGIRLKGEEKV